MNVPLTQIATDAFSTEMEVLAGGVFSFLQKFIVATVAFLILWVVAVAVGKLVEQFVRAIKVDKVLESVGAEEPLERAGFKLNSGAFLGGLVRWFFIILALLVAVDILELQEVSLYLKDIVLGYLPSVIVASIIIVAAALLADAAQKVIRGSAHAAHLPSANLLGAVAKWSIWVFAIIAALFQLGIASRLLELVISGVVGMLAIAGGLAFGLGGKEHASQFIDKIKREIK